MNLYKLCLSFLIISAPFSAKAAETFTIKTSRGQEKIRMIKINEVRFSSDCQKKKCQAWEAFTEKVKPNLKPRKDRGNPASRHCAHLKAKGVILRDAKGRQYDFCRFKDGSMVDSWRLYEEAL